MGSSTFANCIATPFTYFLILSDAVRRNALLQLVQWGPSTAFDKHPAALAKMLASVKLIGN